LEVVTLSVSAPSDGWAYVSLRDGGEVFPANDGEGSWDVAFQRTKVQTNSGTSGEGMGGALVTEASGLEALLEVPEGEFVEDEMVPVPGPPGSGEFSGNPLLNAWYDYDPSSHAVTPKPLVYVIRTADGHYAKLAFLSYGSGTVEVAWMYAGAGRASFAP
jgi:hypothetical protein